jgi:hypothetical protein
MPILYIIIGFLLIILDIEVQTPTWSYKSGTPQYFIGGSLVVMGIVILKMFPS